MSALHQNGPLVHRFSIYASLAQQKEREEGAAPPAFNQSPKTLSYNPRIPL